MHPFLLNKQIDLVDLNDVKLLRFKEDNLYNLSVPANRKNRSLSEHYKSVQRNGYPDSLVTPQNLSSISDARFCLPLALAHMWSQGIDTTVLDLGAFVGDFSIQAGNLIRTFGCESKVHAFDPTEAGALIPHNIAINGLQDIVTHWDLAVSNYNGLMLFNVLSGMLDAAFMDNKGAHKFNLKALVTHFSRTQYKRVYIDKVKRYFRPEKGHNLLVKGVRIADWLEANSITNSLFCKIDIEGMDTEVIRDLLAASPNRNRHLTCIFEFNPNTFPFPRDAIGWLNLLSERFLLFDIWYSPCPAFCKAINVDDIPEFVRSIANERVFGYTDVLMVPKDLPGVQDLSSRLMALKAGPLEYLF
jgi:FkbM family methyltransferase